MHAGPVYVCAHRGPGTGPVLAMSAHEVMPLIFWTLSQVYSHTLESVSFLPAPHANYGK